MASEISADPRVVQSAAAHLAGDHPDTLRWGWLVGAAGQPGQALTVLSTLCALEADEPAMLQELLPVGLVVCGVYLRQADEPTWSGLTRPAQAMHQPEKCSTWAVLRIGDSEEANWTLSTAPGSKEAPASVNSEDAGRFLAARSSVRVQLSLAGADLERAEQLVKSSLVFCPAAGLLVGPDSKELVQDLQQACSEPIMLCQLYAGGESSAARAPMVELAPTEGQRPAGSLSCDLDVLCLVDPHSTLGSLHAGVVQAMLTQLRTANALSPASAWHLQPPQCVHPVVMVVPSEHTDDTAVTLRTRAHLRLSLPLDRPLLRPKGALNALQSGELGSSQRGGIGGPRLSNTHIGLPRAGLQDAVQYLCDGDYDYYHYMQDGFDDNGWGCAYRSLQTIWSWYLKQGYVQRAVPSHREIQQALVEYQAKPHSFLGSKEWLGAIEVASALDQLSDGEIVCNIEYLQQGSDLEDKGNFLMKHFQSCGSPIMMGGGVLAFTMAGIEYNQELGQVRFLILDPHYTGKDAIKSIQPRWCGWKDIEFFDKFSFYNLCCPQRVAGQI